MAPARTASMEQRIGNNHAGTRHYSLFPIRYSPLRHEVLALGEGRARAALAFGLLQEAHADLVSLDVDELAFAVSIPDRREHEEEFVELEVLDAALDRELGAALRDHLDVALTPPRAVDAHDARLEARFEDDLIGTFELVFLGHYRVLDTQPATPSAILARRQKSTVNTTQHVNLALSCTGGLEWSDASIFPSALQGPRPRGEKSQHQHSCISAATKVSASARLRKSRYPTARRSRRSCGSQLSSGCCSISTIDGRTVSTAWSAST